MAERPDEQRQFRVLFRSFLSRMIDLELISSRGEVGALLTQFAAILGAFSFTLTIFLAPRYATSILPPARLMTLAWLDEEFLIGVTMAIAGLFTLLAWNSVLPDRRDTLVLGPLPVRVPTLCKAKAAALLTALALSVFAINAFTGLAYPIVLCQPGFFGWLRGIAAYWITMGAAGLFFCCALLALQGVAAQVFSYRLFQRVSSFLQLAAFFVILAVFFLKPPLATVSKLTDPQNQRLIEWLPTYWFLGLFQQLNGAMHPVFAPLALRAVYGLFAALGLAATTYILAYRNGLRRIVEQPDIFVGDRNRRPSRLITAIANRVFPKPLDRAIVLFSARGIARSRQHRLILAAYGGIALAIALAYLKSHFYPDPHRIGPPVNPDFYLLVPSVVVLVFAIIGARAIFAMPIALSANWIFRITAVHSPQEYFSAARKSLAAIATPVLLASAALYFFLWPGRKAVEHVIVLALLATILTERSLYRFRKIPFACSYLPGKSNLKVKLGMYGFLFLFLCDTGVSIEAAVLPYSSGFAVLALVLIAAAAWSWFRTVRAAQSRLARVVFEELPPADVYSLNLSGEAAAISSEDYAESLEPPAPIGVVFEQYFSDFRAAIRGLAKSLPFTGAAIALIALGIGANTAIYSMIHGVLTRPAPGIQASGLVSMAQTVQGEVTPEFSYPEYLDYALNTQTMRSLAAYGGARFSVTTPEGSFELRAHRITANYFTTLGVALARGRGFTPDEASGAAPLAAVIAYHVWQNQFHGAEDIIGRTISISGLPATIVGVTAQGFRGPQFVPNFEIGVPIAADARLRGTDSKLNDRAFRYVAIIGKLAPRATIARARAEFNGMARYVQSEPHPPTDGAILVDPYSATAFGVWQSAQARCFANIITAVGLLTLLIVCANVANLVLARSVARQREIAVRRSLGASHVRIIRLLLSEALVLAVAASAAALLFASWATRAIVKFVPPLASGARIEPDLTPDAQVAFYALALAVVSAVAFTIAPALRAWRQELLPWLKSGENSVAQGRSALSNFLVVAQLALGVVLLTGAGLASRSLYLIGQTDLHFAKDHLLLVNIDTAGATSPQPLPRLFERIIAIPGVRSASWSTAIPTSNFGGWMESVQSAGAATAVRSNGMYAGPDYLETLGVRGIEGRGITLEDVALRRHAAVINRNLAQTLWPAESALGRELTVFGEAFTVVGVAPNLQPEPRANYVFLPDRPVTGGARVAYIRYAGSLDAITAAVRRAIRDTDPRIPIFTPRTMEMELEQDNGPAILIASLLGFFSTGALILAAAGLYAVVALATARRRRDFGIRMALGASTQQILRTVLREGLQLAAIGALCGIALSIAAARAMGSVLVGVSPTDTVTYCGVIGLLAAVSLLACYVPARRATQIDPSQALRQD